MKTNYYYLVTGLPDLIMDEAKGRVAYKDMAEEIIEQVSDKDSSLIRDLRLQFDKKNVISILNETESDFDERGNYEKDDLAQELKLPDTLPSFIIDYLENRMESKSSEQNLSDENTINDLFYKYMLSHGNTFMAEWFAFDLDLRNILAGISARRMSNDDFSIAANVLGNREVAEHVRKSSAHDFSLASRYPWVDKLVSMEKGNLVEYEKAVDEMRWEKLNEMTEFTYFQVETLLAFLLKVEIVERWQNLDEEEGKKRLDMLLEELGAGLKI